jgi:hypothetical protein
MEEREPASGNEVRRCELRKRRDLQRAAERKHRNRIKTEPLRRGVRGERVPRAVGWWRGEVDMGERTVETSAGGTEGSRTRRWRGASSTPLPPCRLRLAGLAWLHLHFSLLCIFYFIGHCYGGTELGLFTFASPLELKTMNTPTILNNVDFTMNLDRAEKSRGSSSLLPSVFFALIKSKPIECAFLDYRVLRFGNMLRI